MIVSGNFSQLLYPGLRKIWGDTYNQFSTQYDQVFKVENSTRAYETDLLTTDFGLIDEKPEGRAISYDDVYQSWTKEYRHKTYGRGFAVSRELLEDDQYRIIAKKPKALAKSAHQTVEMIAANVLNNAFNGSFPGGDGVSLCNSNHPLTGGGTFSNILPSAADLDTTSIRDALILISEMVDERGLKINVRPAKLLVTPHDEWRAQELLKSEKLINTSYNNINPAKGLMPYVVLNWLSDPESWFILTDVDNGLMFFWRRKPEFVTDGDFSTDISLFKTTFRFSCGWTDPRCIVGTAGI